MNKKDNYLKSKIYKKVIPEFKIRNYCHFDTPSTAQEQEAVDSLYQRITDYDYVKSHGFYPLIEKNIKERRRSKLEHYLYYKQLLETESDPEILEVCRKNVEEFEKKGLVKQREIRIASHLDSLIFSHYAIYLDDKYNKRAQELGISDEIVANRLTWQPKAVAEEKINANTSAAFDAVQFILSKNCDCYALAFDLSSFYDSINHKKLKEEWKKLLNVDELPADHYAIYKALTKSCYVKQSELEEYMVHMRKKEEAFVWKEKRLQGAVVPESELSPEEKAQLDQKCAFKSIFKTPKDFRKFRSWYNHNPKYKSFSNFHRSEGFGKYGLPQGVSISSVLSNIYMLPFDIKIHDFVVKNGGFYRRYCDDILLVLPHDENLKDSAIAYLKECIEERGKELKLHNISPWDKYSKSQCYDFTDKAGIKARPMQYLGYYFDGSQVRLREGSLSRYRRNMTKYFWHVFCNKRNQMHRQLETDAELAVNLKSDEFGKFYDEFINSFELHRHKFYQKFTFRGHKNFISYANKSAQKFKKVLADTAGVSDENFVTSIERQIRNHCALVKKMIADFNQELKDKSRKLFWVYLDRAIAKINVAKINAFLEKLTKSECNDNGECEQEASSDNN